MTRAGAAWSSAVRPASCLSVQAKEWNHEQNHLARGRRRHYLVRLGLLRLALSPRSLALRPQLPPGHPTCPSAAEHEAPGQGAQGHRCAVRAAAPHRMIAPETLAAATRVARNRARRSAPSAADAVQKSAVLDGSQGHEPRGKVAAEPRAAAIATDGSVEEFQPPADLPTRPAAHALELSTAASR